MVVYSKLEDEFSSDKRLNLVYLDISEICIDILQHSKRNRQTKKVSYPVQAFALAYTFEKKEALSGTPRLLPFFPYLLDQLQKHCPDQEKCWTSSWFASCIYEELLPCYLGTCLKQSNNHHYKNSLKSYSAEEHAVMKRYSFHLPMFLKPAQPAKLQCLLYSHLPVCYLCGSSGAIFSLNLFCLSSVLLKLSKTRSILFFFFFFSLWKAILSQVCGYWLVSSCFVFLLQLQVLVTCFSSDTSVWKAIWLDSLNSERCFSLTQLFTP